MTKLISILLVILLLLVTGILIVFLLFPLFSQYSLNTQSDDTDNFMLEESYPLVVGDFLITKNNNPTEYITLDKTYPTIEKVYLDNDSEIGGGNRIIECTRDSECGEYSSSAPFCFLGDIYKKNYENSCKQSHCRQKTSRVLIEQCSGGCTNGQCVAISCNKNSDCGTDGFVGGNYCKDDDVTKDLKTYRCNNPGTATSSCSSTTQPKVVQECTYGCNNGSCKGVPSVQIISPSNGATIANNIFLLDFKTMNWVVKGKEDTHIHFHIDNVPGLSYSDHLMFYNSPHNVVELNFVPGTTSFATWIDEDTVRFNNVPNGVHKIRAHLATAAHLAPGNPEADVEISVTVMVSTCVDNDHDGYDTCKVGDPGDDGKVVDCNDNDSAVHPNANEVCDGRDNDCNGQVDENNGMCESGKICTNGQCVAISCNKNSDCGTDGLGQKFCKLNEPNVYQTEITWQCLNPGTIQSSCIKNETEKKILVCPSTHLCVNGDCLPITCNFNADCGIDDFVGKKFCQNNDVYQNRKIFMCMKPGTATSSCSSNIKAQLVEDCSNSCSNGQCITEICTNGIDDDGDGFIDKLVELNPNNGKTKKFSDKAPWEVYSNLEVFMRAHGQQSPRDLLGVDTDGGMALVHDSLTATKFCTIMGYRTVSSVHPFDYTGRTIWTSGGDSTYNWNGTQWQRTDDLASYRNPNNAQWIADITCIDRLPACSDGIDNDGDGKIDALDRGCASSTDDSEIGHDPECVA